MIKKLLIKEFINFFPDKLLGKALSYKEIVTFSNCITHVGVIFHVLSKLYSVNFIPSGQIFIYINFQKNTII